MPLVRYSNGGNRFITLASGVSGNTTLDLRTAITQAGYDYTKLTTNDFLYKFVRWNMTGGNCSGWYSTSANTSISYAPTTGKLTVSGAYNSVTTLPNGSVSATMVGDILLIT